MTSTRLGAAVFAGGAVLLFMHTTALFLWWAVGIPWSYPFFASEGPLYYLSGFTPLIGPLTMVIGGIIYGRGEGGAKS